MDTSNDGDSESEEGYEYFRAPGAGGPPPPVVGPDHRLSTAIMLYEGRRDDRFVDAFGPPKPSLAACEVVSRGDDAMEVWAAPRDPLAELNPQTAPAAPVSSFGRSLPGLTLGEELGQGPTCPIPGAGGRAPPSAPRRRRDDDDDGGGGPAKRGRLAVPHRTRPRAMSEDDAGAGSPSKRTRRVCRYSADAWSAGDPASTAIARESGAYFFPASDVETSREIRSQKEPPGPRRYQRDAGYGPATAWALASGAALHPNPLTTDLPLRLATALPSGALSGSADRDYAKTVGFL